jgi:hypothetical protein
MAALAGDTLVSEMSDNRDAWLDTEVAIDGAEYARIMRTVTPQVDGAALPVSAFNSSI